jgi:hypothetical protein
MVAGRPLYCTKVLVKVLAYQPCVAAVFGRVDKKARVNLRDFCCWCLLEMSKIPRHDTEYAVLALVIEPFWSLY